MYKRKIWASVIILISIIITCVISRTQFSSENVEAWNLLYLSDKQFEAISTSGNISDSVLTTEIYFNDQLLLYDSIDNTFYYSLIENDPLAYTPVVELANPDIKVAAYGAAISDDVIASNTPITLLLMEGNTVSISNLICTTLPIMNIDISQEDINSLGLDDTYDILSDTASSVYLYDNRADFDGINRTTIVDSKIRRRGQTNAVYPTKGYRLTLLADKTQPDGDREKVNILGLREDDDWILYTAYKDYEKVRNVFSMNLWHDSVTKDNEWNVANSTEYKYLELFINNHYHGLYAICYPLDKKQFDIQDGESLFKKMDWTHSEQYTALEYQEYANGDGGDYLLPGYSLKEGTTDDYNDLLKLYVNMTYSTDSQVVRMTSDVTNSIDLWLFFKLTQSVDSIADAGVKNMYVAIKNSSSGIEGQKLLFSPWDMDQTWRHVADGSDGQYADPAYDLPIEWGTVFNLMRTGDETISADIKYRYEYLRSTAWSNESILASLDEYEADIYSSGAFLRTQTRWPEGNYNDSYYRLTEFKDYVIKRLEYMDEYIKNLK